MQLPRSVRVWGSLTPRLRAMTAAALVAAATVTIWGCRSCTGPGTGLPVGSLPPRLVALRLSRGDFPVRCYEPRDIVRGVVLFGSGDGGWKSWEEKASRSLALAGYRVIGWDCRAYAETPYDASQLGEDLMSMGRKACRESPRLPVLYGGYSTGAEQAVAAAAWDLHLAHQPGARSGVIGEAAAPSGLLLVGPGERGRYGITLSDLMGKTPEGAGTFALRDLAPELDGIPVLQIHGPLDPLDATGWLSALRGPHRLVILPGQGHFFGDAGPELRKALVEGADWLIGIPSSGAAR